MPWRMLTKTGSKAWVCVWRECSKRADAVTILHGAGCIADTTLRACVGGLRSGILVGNPMFPPTPRRSSPLFRAIHLAAFNGIIVAVISMTGFLPGVGVARAESVYFFATTPGKLPKTVVPVHYAIDLKPNLATLADSGSEVVDIRVLTPTDRLVLNAVDIAIRSASLEGEAGQVASVTPQPKAQTVTLAFPHALAVGPHKLAIAFTGRINRFGRGLFSVDYPTAHGRKRMIATELEPADARRVFPCWDEPAFKASFEPSVTVPRNFLAVSNMPIAREEPAGADMKRISFGATPRMSSYLFVLVAGDLERLTGDANGVTVGVVTVEGKREQGRYALASAIRLLGYYNDYFGIEYPLPKLDLIAVPGGVGGAMENWGGIVFNESLLLFDPSSSPDALRRGIFAVLAHEMAHQWFGDLVTMGWWNDLWLNEGFASWMQNKAAAALHPDWHVWLNGSGAKQRAMEEDARLTAHPIQQPVADESEAESAFDSITYLKSQAFIRELEGYLGAEKFRAGIRRYIAAHAYDNATTADLWQALARASGKQVASIANPYTEQPGLPLIVSSASCVNNRQRLALCQERFITDSRGAKVGAQLWQIPIAFGPPGAREPSGVVLLREKTMQVEAGRCGEPMKLNFGDVGYYRTLYDAATEAALAKSIETMGPADRVNLLADNWALLQAGRMTPGEYFRLVDKVAKDRNRAVLEQVIRTFGRLDDLERGLPGRPALQSYARSRLRPAFERLGWNRAAGESEGNTTDDAIVRSSLIAELGDLGDGAVIAEARRRFAAFVKDPKSLDVNLRGPVVFLAGRGADRATYDELRALGRKATSTELRVRYYLALAAVVNPELVKETLAITLTNEVPVDLANGIILTVAAGEHPELALAFVKANFKALAAKRDPTFRAFFMPMLMANFADRAHAVELADFAPAHETAGGRIAAARARAEIMEKADFRAREIPAVDQWVKHPPALP
jgi:aminopeptidase N